MDDAPYMTCCPRFYVLGHATAAHARLRRYVDYSLRGIFFYVEKEPTPFIHSVSELQSQHKHEQQLGVPTALRKKKREKRMHIGTPCPAPEFMGTHIGLGQFAFHPKKDAWGRQPSQVGVVKGSKF